MRHNTPLSENPLPNENTLDIFKKVSSPHLFEINRYKDDSVFRRQSDINQHINWLKKYTLVEDAKTGNGAPALVKGKNYDEAYEFDTLNDWLAFRRDRQEKESELLRLSILAHSESIETNKVIRESTFWNKSATIAIAIFTIVSAIATTGIWLQGCNKDQQTDKKQESKKLQERPLPRIYQGHKR